MRLELHRGPTDGWATLNTQRLPFLVGNSPEDLSWECPCGATVGTGLYSRQVLNILIRCGACSAVLESPRRTPGQPIAGRPVYLQPGGTYRLEGVLDLVDKPVMMVGHTALVDHSRETGRLIPGIYDPSLRPVLDKLDSDSLLKLAEELRLLLGDEYQRLSDADARGRKSRTPPISRHRLIELAEFAQQTAQTLADWDGNGQVSVNGNLLAESITVIAAASRWRHHPAWPGLRATLTSDTEPPHTVMLLTIASYLADANNGVGVHVGASRQRVTTADIWIEPDLTQRVDLEVKTPMRLRGPQQPVSEPHAIKILERALKKSSRQRGNTNSSLLAVGGYHMGSSYDTMVSTAKAMLALERRKWRGLAGILVVDCTYNQSLRSSDLATQFSPVARLELARHPGYQGGLTIDSDAPPTG